MITPFRRVGGDISVDPRLQDNSFEAKGGARGSWGERANKDLKFTKGMCIIQLSVAMGTAMFASVYSFHKYANSQMYCT